MATSSFDMKDTLEWYAENIERIQLPREASEGEPNIVGQLKDISATCIAALMNLFPSRARARSVYRQIVAKPETWFLPNAAEIIADKKDPTTENRAQADTVTSIVPSAFMPINWEEGDIWLYNIPPEAAPNPKVRMLVAAEGLIHEYAHSINFIPRHRGENITLTFPSGKRLSGTQSLEHFLELMEGISEPISHYSAGYWDRGKFPNPENHLLSADEELSEAIAAHYLGLTFSDNPERRDNPFLNRPEIKTFVENYLNAIASGPEKI